MIIKSNNMAQPINETQLRLYEKLHRDLGGEIISLLQNKDLNEIMLNPDGELWVDSALAGLVRISSIKPTQAISIIHTVAGIHSLIVSQQNPKLEAGLPFFKSMQGERFSAQIPPIVANPSFCIRKKSNMAFNLDDYVRSGRLAMKQQMVIKKLIYQRKNILVCGGPGSGKTTFTNTLINEAVTVDQKQRFVILEDTPELQCDAANKVSMLTSDRVSMTGLIHAAMRMRPDRILMGEIRGGEALDLLKAWNTGCPGGICTIHANNARDAIQRLLDLAMEANLASPPITLTKHTVDAIVSVTRNNNKKGYIEEILAIKEYSNEKFTFEKLA